MHMKKNTPFGMLLRALRYCSSFNLFISERESLRMALLLNKYPDTLIQKQFELVFRKLNITVPVSSQNYETIRSIVVTAPHQERLPVDYENNLFVHFTYCASMKAFPIRFHSLWRKYFSSSPINDITPILGTRNVLNLQRQFNSKGNIR